MYPLVANPMMTEWGMGEAASVEGVEMVSTGDG